MARPKRVDIPFPSQGMDETGDAYQYGSQTTPGSANVVPRLGSAAGHEQGARPGMVLSSAPGTVETLLPISTTVAGVMTQRVVIVVGGVVTLL